MFLNRLTSLLTREDIAARALRGSGLTLIRFGGGNVLRLISNLILTRLLFPEVFGLMALVQVFITGLQMFSDIGINTSIIQSKRGDDPDFLNTAWTLKIIRGFCLWFVACALAPVAVLIYDESQLLQLLPAVGLSMVIQGFGTTKMAAANRHLRLGRQTFIGLGCQAMGIVISTVLAYYLRSVWALVLGSLIGTLLQTIIMHLAMPGVNNRLKWDYSAVREIFGFGKFIFLSTLAGFIINQGDRAILGGYITLAELGIYNIGLFLGTFPLLLSRSLNAKIIFPLYRMRNPAEDVKNLKKIARARNKQIGATLCLAACLGFSGPWLADVLYDDRYALAGPIITLFSIAIVPQLVLDGYSGVFLSNGDSKRFFILLSLTAVLQSTLLVIGITWFGLFGAILSQGIAALLTYPLRIRFVKIYDAWDRRGDALFLSMGLLVTGAACFIHWDSLMALTK